MMAIANNEEYIKTYCYGRYTKFSNINLGWFLCNKPKNAIEYEKLCFECDANVEDRDDVCSD